MNDFEFVTRLQEVVAKAAGFKTRRELLSREDFRTAKFRTVAIYLARKNTGLGVEALGTLFNRDHSTISYAVRRETTLLAHHAPPPISLAMRVNKSRAEWHAELLATVRAAVEKAAEVKPVDDKPAEEKPTNA